MNDSENKKAPEELPDEALDAVSGGKRDESVMEVLPSCHDCQRRGVKLSDFLDTDGSDIKLCPICAENRRRRGETLWSVVSM